MTTNCDPKIFRAEVEGYVHNFGCVPGDMEAWTKFIKSNCTTTFYHWQSGGKGGCYYNEKTGSVFVSFESGRLYEINRDAIMQTAIALEVAALEQEENEE